MWIVFVVFVVVVGFNGWNYWQCCQVVEVFGLYEQVQKVVVVNDKVMMVCVVVDMEDKFGSMLYVQMMVFVVVKMLYVVGDVVGVKVQL